MYDKNIEFEIRSALWQRIVMYVTAIIGVAGAIVTTPLICLDLIPGKNTWGIIIICGILAVIGGVGTYVALWEKFVLKDGVFIYRKPFRRTCRARIEDLAAVSVTGVRLLSVEFLGRDGKEIFSVLDDGTMLRSGEFVRALDALGIDRKGVLNRSYLH